MRRHLLHSGVVISLICFSLGGSARAEDKKEQKDWSMNATIIEACSCPMFCQCYFDSKPASPGEGAAAHKGHEGHAMAGGKPMCKFNNAYKVNKGSYGDVNLDGAKFW